MPTVTAPPVTVAGCALYLGVAYQARMVDDSLLTFRRRPYVATANRAYVVNVDTGAERTLDASNVKWVAPLTEAAALRECSRCCYPLGPVDAMVGTVHGECARAAHREAAGLPR